MHAIFLILGGFGYGYRHSFQMGLEKGSFSELMEDSKVVLMSLWLQQWVRMSMDLVLLP